MQQRGSTLVIREVELSRLEPYAYNARTHTDQQIDQIAASIRRFGWTNPVLIDEAGTIIAGHGRVLAARQLGMTAVPTIALAGLSPAEKRAYVLADNRLALNAGWNEALLARELEALRAIDFDLDLLGFANDELERLLADVATDQAAGLDPSQEHGVGAEDPVSGWTIPEHPVTRAGDVWRCGPHRVMCGDCRKADDVDRLLAGAVINLAFTSPPYADRREYDPSSGFEPIRPDDYVAWFAPVAANVRRVLAPDGSWFVNIKPGAADLDTELYVLDLVLAHARDWGWHFATEFCWQRNGVPKAVHLRFKNQFEPIYQFVLNRWKMRPDAVRHPSDAVPIPGGPGVGETNWANAQGSATAIFGGARKRLHGTSETMSEVQGNNCAPGEYIAPGLAYPGNRLPTFVGSHEALGHHAAFPVGLPDWFIRAYSDEGDTVFDPFLGSGSTLIAAQRRQRRGFGMELSPAYTDIIITRWMRETGEVAMREADNTRFPHESTSLAA